MKLEKLEFVNPYYKVLDERNSQKEIVLRHGHIAITNYKLGDNPPFEKLLSVWNKMYWRYEQAAGYYIPKLKEFRIGRGFDIRRLHRLFPDHMIRVDNCPYHADKVEYNLTTPPRSDFQRVALTFMASQSPYKRNKDYTQQLIAAKPGEGKAVPDDAMIPTPDGLRRMDEIKEGDYVYNINRQPTKVLKVYPQGVQKTYKLTFDDGRTARCNLEHLWYVICNGEPVVAPLYALMWPEAANEDIYIPCPAENKNIRIVNIEQIEDLPQRCILIDDPLHVFLTENDIPTHNTYCGVAISAYFKAKVIVVCPISKLLSQWKESYMNFTSLTDKQIMIVKGSKACEKIRMGRCKDIVVFIFTSDTIMAYIKNYGERACIEMLMQTGAYIKIIDEIHKDMRVVSAIEAMSNFNLNFYMSASPLRSDEKENLIFSLMYNGVPKFGDNFQMEEERHINIVVKHYKFIPNDQQIRSMYRPNVGLNTKSYERVLVNADDWQRKDFDQSINTMLRWSKDLLKKDNKILVLCQTVDGTKFMEKLAEKVFPGECSHYYATGMNKTEKEDALKKRVICATASSMGTGADVPGIQHVINICTYSNPIDATQLPGRARKLKDGTPVVYVEMVNMGYRKTVSQYESRRKYLANNAANGKIMTIR